MKFFRAMARTALPEVQTQDVLAKEKESPPPKNSTFPT